MTPTTFDHTSESHAGNWRRIYAEARGKTPVVRSGRHGGYYALTRHADIVEALRDHESFSSERSWHDDGTDKRLGVAIPHQPVILDLLGVPLARWSEYADVTERMVRQTEDRSEGATIAHVRACEGIPLTNGFYSMTVTYRPGEREGDDLGDLPRLTGERMGQAR